MLVTGSGIEKNQRRSVARVEHGCYRDSQGVRDTLVKATVSPASGLTLDITSAGIGGNGGSIAC